MYRLLPTLAGLFLLWPLHLAAQPQRIVSLDLCSDWLLLEYAQPGQVLAYSPFLYLYPRDGIPRDFPVHNGSLEQVYALRPDVIISGEFNARLLRQRLQQLGLRSEVLPNPRSLADIEGYIQRLLAILAVNSESKGGFRVNGAKSYPARGQTLLLLGANGIGTGHDTLEHDILTAAGWDNYLQQSGYSALPMESLLHTSPDVIFSTLKEQGPSLANHFITHPALTRTMHNRISVGLRNWRWQCPGPWTYQLIEELASWPNP